MSSNLNRFIQTLTTINEYIESLKKYQSFFLEKGNGKVVQDRAVLGIHTEFYDNKEIPLSILTQKDFENIIAIVKNRIDSEITVAEERANQVINSRIEKSDINE